MSNYLWTLRSQTVKAKDQTGMASGTIEMALFSFVTGNIDSWDGPSRHEKACAALAEQAWDKLSVDGKVPYVVLGDKGDIAKLRSGETDYLTVYRGCNGRQWTDCNIFPAEAVYGLLVKDGGRLAICSVCVGSQLERGIAVVSKVGLTAADGSGGWVPLTGTRVEVIDDVVRETMRQMELPNGECVWVSMRDKEATQCVADDWAPVWKAEKEAKAKAQQAIALKGRLSAIEKEGRENFGKRVDLADKMSQLSVQEEARKVQENTIKEELQKMEGAAA